RTYETYSAILEAALQQGPSDPDAIVVTGDVVQDESRAGYEQFRASLEHCGVPVLVTSGNHDDPLMMSEVLSSQPFQVDRSIRLAQWSLIAVSTHLLGEDAGGLGPRRLESLKRAITEHRDQHVLICMHHHPLPMGSRWLDAVALRDADEFLRLVDTFDNVRAVTCGHVHQASERDRNGVTYFSTPSTCSQFLPNSEGFALDDKPPGCRWFELHADGQFESQIQWLESK
ncbi:MAG: metallophosphoesterase, partial [Gammaproteobacteria bacterium]